MGADTEKEREPNWRLVRGTWRSLDVVLLSDCYLIVSLFDVGLFCLVGDLWGPLVVCIFLAM